MHFLCLATTTPVPEYNRYYSMQKHEAHLILLLRDAGKTILGDTIGLASVLT